MLLARQKLEEMALAIPETNVRPWEEQHRALVLQDSASAARVRNDFIYF